MTLRVADMPAVYRKWLDGVEPAWTVLEAERIDALVAEPPFEDGAIRLAIDLTDDEIACSPRVQNALVLVRAAGEADGLELTARGNLTRETVAAMRSAMDWPGLLFEEKWRAGKRLREGHVEELRLVRELAMMNGLLIRKKGRLRVGATGRRALKDRRERLQASFFRDCFWQVSLDLFGEPECGSWPQGLIGPALWSLASTGDRWQDRGRTELIYSPNVRKCAQTTRGHWMSAVSPLLIEGDENWFRRQPYSRVRKPHTAAVSAALTPHIVQE